MSTQGVSSNKVHTYDPTASVGKSVPGKSLTNDGAASFSDGEFDLSDVGINKGGQGTTPGMPPPSVAKPSIVLSTDKALSELSVGHAETDTFAVAALLTTSLLEQRSGARQTRGHALQTELKFKRAAVDTIRKAIPQRMWGGIISGAMTAVGGAFALGGALKTGKASGKTLDGALKTKPVFETNAVNPPASLTKPPVDVKTPQPGIELGEIKNITPPKTPASTGVAANSDSNTKPLNSPSTQSDTPSSPATEKSVKQRNLEAKEMEIWQKDLANQLHADGLSATKGEAASKLLAGSGNAIHAFQESSAAENDAKKTDEEATAKAYEIGYQQSSEMMSQVQDLLRDLREKLSATLQSEVETTRAISRNI